MLNELFRNDSWIGTDVSLEHCHWVALKSGGVYVLNDLGGGEQWYRSDWELTLDSIEEMENQIGIDNLISACAEYEEYVESGDIFGRFGVAIWYNNGLSEYCGADNGISFIEMARILGDDPTDFCEENCENERCNAPLSTDVPPGNCEDELSVFNGYCGECYALNSSYDDELSECQQIVDTMDLGSEIVWLELHDEFPVSGVEVCCGDDTTVVRWTGDTVSMIAQINAQIN